MQHPAENGSDQSPRPKRVGHIVLRFKKVHTKAPLSADDPSEEIVILPAYLGSEIEAILFDPE